MECAPTVNFMYQWLVLEKDYIHVLTVEKWLNNTSMAQLNMYLWAMARIKFKEIVLRDKPKKRPGRHKKRRNKHEKRQQKKRKKGWQISFLILYIGHESKKEKSKMS